MSRRIHLVWVALCMFAASAGGEGFSPQARLYDTGRPAATPLSADTLAKRPGWKQLAEDNVTHRFAGDSVVMNGKLAVVVRPKAGGMEVYSVAAGGCVLRASLACAAGRSSTAGGITKLAIAEHDSSAVALTLTFGGPKASDVTLRLTSGESILAITPGGGTSALTVVTQSRYIVVPNFFGDDMVFGPGAIGGVGLPAESFLLNPIDGGEAIMMCVWQPRRLGASAVIAKGPKDAWQCTSRIDMVAGKAVWVAMLEGKGIWYERPAGRAATGEKPPWKPPFAATWRCSRPESSGFASSLDLASFLAGKLKGPAVVYPLDRVLATPMTVYGPTDVLRNTLGVGPCEHILASEGLTAPANPTPDNVMTWVQRQFKRRRGRPTADEVRKRLGAMKGHIGRARQRIMKYRDLASAVQALCRASAPLSPAAARLQDTALRIAKTAEAGIMACGHVEGAEQLAAAVLALTDKPDAAAKCGPLADQLRAIGAAQNRTLSTSRMAACRLRQQCIAVAREDPKVAALAAEIRLRVERDLK